MSARKRRLTGTLMMATLTAAVAVAYWFGSLYPRYLEREIAQIELKAVQIGHLLESQISAHVLATGEVGEALIVQLALARERAGLLKVKLFDIRGRTIYSTEPAEIGEVNEHDYFSEVVLRGEQYTKLVRSESSGLDGSAFSVDVVETYVPIVSGDTVQGAFEIYLDVTEELGTMMRFATRISRDFLFVTLFLVLLVLGMLRRSYRRALREERTQRCELQQEIERRMAVENDLRDNEQRFEHLAHHDPLTGLPNRRMFLERLRRSLLLARRARTKSAVLFLDLDRFKTINDSLGHKVGDQLIVAVSRILTDAVREVDTVARMGGDEFTILIDHLEDAIEASHLAERILELLERSFSVGGYTIRTDASIGIAVAPVDGESPDDLLKNADTAMYQAKEHGRGCFRYYMPEMNARAEVKLQLENSITRAIEEGQMRIHYQPQIDLRTGKMRGVEALVRWNHPELGLVMPGEFIPLAEESGIIVHMGGWLIHEACRQLREWNDAGYAGLVMAVNLSARQFRDRGLSAKVFDAIDASGISPRQLELELTESLIMARPEDGVALLQQFADAGLRIAVDDFGTGYSSLSHLRKFPIHQLKIDRSFVMDIDQPDDAQIVRTILTLAHSLDLEVVAEGIETRSQLRFLQEFGCEYGQGFLFDRALTADMVTQRLAGERQEEVRGMWRDVPVIPLFARPV